MDDFIKEMNGELAKISANNGAKKIINRIAEEIQKVHDEHKEINDRMRILEEKGVKKQ